VRYALAARAVAERERDRLRQEAGAVRSRFEEELAAAREEAVRLRGALEARAAEVEEREGALERREAELSLREAVTDERDAARRERDAATAEREAATRERDSAVGEREALIAERERAVRERRAAVAERDAARRERDTATAARDAALADRDRVQRVRQGPPRPAPGATEPAVKVLGAVPEDGRADDDATTAEPTAAQPSPIVTVIEDESVAGAHGWAAADPDRKPLLTRAQPLDRGRGGAAAWVVRLAVLMALVAVVAVVAVLLAGGVL
jgi:hypothetical protein